MPSVVSWGRLRPLSVESVVGVRPVVYVRALDLQTKTPNSSCEIFGRTLPAKGKL